MAPKPHGKDPAKSTKSPDVPKLIPAHLLVPYESLGQPSSSNRFQILSQPSTPGHRVRPSSTRPNTALSLSSQYSKPTYSALASQSPDPYAIIETLSPAQSPLRLQKPAQSPENRLQKRTTGHNTYLPRNPSEYVLKSSLQNVFHVEHCHQDLLHSEVAVSQREQASMLKVQIGKLLRAYLPPKWHFMPEHPSKSIVFYKAILIHTESARIEPIIDRFDPAQKRIVFHKLFIVKIISCEDWGSHPSIIREIPGQPIGFNYYDYIEAWSKVFLYQNEDFTHSWFINFDNKFSSQLPVWFNRWWQLYGSLTDIIPQPLLKSIARFSNCAEISHQNKQFPLLCLFSSKYKIPWILQWDYQVQNNICARRFHVKWWDKFQVERINDQVTKEFPKEAESAAITQFLAHKASLQTELASAMSQVKSPADLLELSQNLQLAVSQLSHTEPDEHSPASSPGSVTSESKPNYLDPLFQDSQDPYDVHLDDM